MPVPLIACRNQVTGAEAEIPETALPHMTDWVPVDQPDAESPADEAPTRQATATPEPQLSPAPRTAKSKAAESAKNTEEK